MAVCQHRIVFTSQVLCVTHKLRVTFFFKPWKLANMSGVNTNLILHQNNYSKLAPGLIFNS
jgi:hypothetical protein